MMSNINSSLREVLKFTFLLIAQILNFKFVLRQNKCTIIGLINFTIKTILSFD